MKITPQCVAALTWTLKDSLGDTLDILDTPVEFLIGGDDLLPRIEQALQGHGAGAKVALHLEPLDAFGDFDEHLLHLAPRHLFASTLEEGTILEGRALPEGAGIAPPRRDFYTVSGVYPDHVVLDGNHPLAGISLQLALQVHAVRAASPEELQRRSAGTGFFRLASAAASPQRGDG